MKKKYLISLLCVLVSTHFVYGNTWVIEQLGLDIDGEAAGDYSGWSVSMSADGDVVAIGATANRANGSSSGHVRIYQWNGSSWQQLGLDIDSEAEGDQCGYSVSMSAGGDVVAIGARYNDGNGSYSGHVRIYQWNSSTWQQLGLDIDGEAARDQSGSVSMSADGGTVAIGAAGNDGNGSASGHVRIYQWNGSGWQQLGLDIDGEAAGDLSGQSVSMSAGGDTVAIGAYHNHDNGSYSGHVRIYQWNGSSWQQLGLDIDGETAGDQSGYSISMSADGDTIAIGAYRNDENGDDSGHVRIYQWNGSSWQQLGLDIDGEAAGDQCGYSVSMSASGDTVAIGARNNHGNSSYSGHVRIYQWNGSSWQQLGLDVDGEAAGDQSGSSVSMSAGGDTVAIGATVNDGNGSASGHVRIYSIIELEPPAFVIDGFYESISSQSITVDATPTAGYPTNFTYQWYFNGYAIPSSVGGTASTYPIDGSTDSNGTWQVVVTNTTGSTEASFEYRVFTDADSDGLSDYRESNITNTNPAVADTDIDGLSDFVEVNTTLTDPNDNDSDNDTLLDGAEVNTYGSNPNDADSDGDKLSDAAEVNTHNTSPIDADSDDDTLTDYEEVTTYFTNPNLADSDSDGLTDSAELNTYFTLPNIADSDGDGLSDGDEVNIHSSSPIDVDTDDDTIQDGIEVRYATFGFDPVVDSTDRLASFQAAAAELPGVLTEEQSNGLSLGGVSLTPSGANTFSVDFIIEESVDLPDWTTVDTISHSLDVSGTKKFIRVRKVDAPL